MEITNLPPGIAAPKDADCVHIEKSEGGRFRLNCSALQASGDSEEVESVAMIGGDTYATYEDAEAAGLAWAAGENVQRLYVSRSE